MNILSKIIATIDNNKLTVFDLMALRNGIPPKRLDEFWKFCFGSDYRKLKPADLPDRWNNLHSDILIILPHHTVDKSIQFMCAVFMTK